MARSSAWKAIGPGVLFAGTAVGVSHLVQSTRAGASAGVALIGVVLLANFVKYPAFRIGPLYASATGTSLLEGYRRQGRWALVLCALLTVGTMFTVEAAIALVTAGLAKELLGLPGSPLVISAALIAISSVLVGTGGYRALDWVGKLTVAILAVTTVVATALVLPRVDLSGPWVPDLAAMPAAEIAFLAALIGWMPSAIDVSAWQSLWSLARERQTGHRASAREAGLDFHVGYIATALLAVCFVLLGAGVMHGRGVALDPRPGVFAGQLISLYADALGPWSRPLVGAAALATMVSTLVTVVDGFPRVLAVLFDRLRASEAERPAHDVDRRPVYWIVLVTIGLGALGVIAFLASSMRALVDLATTLSFFSAPLLAWLNHRAITGAEIPEAARPARWFLAASLAGVILQGVFAGAFAWLTFG